MPMSSGGYAASSSGCATRPKVREIGSTGYAGPTQHSSPIGRYVMATAEQREPCDSRGSCTVLGAPGGEIPPGDSTILLQKSAIREASDFLTRRLHIRQGARHLHVSRRQDPHERTIKNHRTQFSTRSSSI